MKHTLLSRGTAAAATVLFASAFVLAGCATTEATKGEAMKTNTVAVSRPSLESQTLGMETLGNARELGGYLTADGKTVKHGLLLRSAKPSGASEADRARLRDVYKLAVITDFRMSFERAAEPNPAIDGVADVWCPIIDEDLIRANVSGKDAGDALKTASIMDKLRIAVESGVVGENMYVGFLSGDQGKKGYTEFFRQLLSLPEERALLFHCTQGKDRTGLGAMLLLSALGVDEETILQDYLLTNTFNASLIEKERAMLAPYKLSEEETQLYLSVMDYVNESFMRKALDWLKANYGSPLGYITQELGVTETDIAALKAKFLE